ncbi:MAG: nucleotidyltransferase domain-containing protein [Parachlamydiaceae bacterium]
MKHPRLTPQVLDSIKSTFLDCFPQGSQLYLFGSQVDPEKKGGDIDLYIESPLDKAEEVTDAKEKFLTQLFFKIGDQKVDVIIKFKMELPIHEAL